MTDNDDFDLTKEPRKMSDRELLIAIGTYAFGPKWQSALGEALGVQQTQLSKVVKKTASVSDTIMARLYVKTPEFEIGLNYRAQMLAYLQKEAARRFKNRSDK